MTKQPATKHPKPLPHLGGGATEGCPVGDLFTMLGKPHTLRILHSILQRDGSRARFSELAAELDLAPKTLSIRLKSLVDAGILLRRSYHEIPPRVEYEATDKAHAFGEVYQALSRWAERNDLHSRAVVSVTGRL
jgi:DNA-binding HxlR family transcriptional regulator